MRERVASGKELMVAPLEIQKEGSVTCVNNGILRDEKLACKLIRN